MSGKLMSQKYPAAAAKFEPAMTFEEIGEILGIPKQTVYFHFVCALNKLRRKPSTVRALRELIEMRTALRERPASYGCVIARKS